MVITRKPFAILKILALVFIVGLMNALPLQAQGAANWQTPSDSLHESQSKLLKIMIAGGLGYAASMLSLYFAWYKQYPMSRFHFFDDSDEWLQMDKMGHIFTSYQMGRLGYHTMRWAGVSEKQSTWYGGMAGSVFLTTIEILDGFSSGWGASVSDLAANTAGSVLFVAQQAAWGEQRMLVKFSYHPTSYARQRPSVLGESHLERLLKDYNGHTFWLSVNPRSFGLGWSPDWLNVALGYGATGMIDGHGNYQLGSDFQHVRRRQFYLSLDVDTERIKTRKEWFRKTLLWISFIKIPFPALEYKPGSGLILHPLYF